MIKRNKSEQKCIKKIKYWFSIHDSLTSGIHITEQKMKFSSKDFFSKCDQIHRKLQI